MRANLIRPVNSATILAPENASLIAEYAAECSIAEIGKINPQPAIYATLEKAGMARMFGAYSRDVLVGFASVLITPLPHYGVRVATVESLFVSAAFRTLGFGPQLMRAVEDCAKENGCQAILYSAPAGGKLERVLSKRKRTRRTNTVYCMALS